MIVLIPAIKVLQPAIEPIQCTTSLNNIKQIQYHYRLLINGSPSSVCIEGEEAAVDESMCVCIHNIICLLIHCKGAWLLLGVRVGNVQKARPSTHPQKLCKACDAS